jgi:hypothetical protein
MSTIEGREEVPDHWNADGRTEAVSVTEPLVVEIDGRDTLEEALIVGDEVLIGQPVLEKLDLFVDSRRRRLVPNPAHPDQPVTKVKSAATRAVKRVTALLSVLGAEGDRVLVARTGHACAGDSRADRWPPDRVLAGTGRDGRAPTGARESTRGTSRGQDRTTSIATDNPALERTRAAHRERLAQPP